MSEPKRQPWWHELPEDTQREADGVATAAHEAVRLAAAVSEWASRSGLSDTIRAIAAQTGEGLRGAATMAAQAATKPQSHQQSASPPEPDAAESADGFGGAPTCEYCPVCQGMSLLRSVSPEAAAGMAQALAAVTDAVKQTVDGLSAPADGRTHVEHIDIE